MQKKSKGKHILHFELILDYHDLKTCDKWDLDLNVSKCNFK